MADLDTNLIGLLEHVGQPGDPVDPANSEPGLPPEPPEGWVPIRLGTALMPRIAYLDARDAENFDFWRTLLQDLKEHKATVRAQVEPATRLLKDITLPMATRVTRVTEGVDGRWRIRLNRSDASHAVSTDTEDGAALLRRLNELNASGTEVMVTVDWDRKRIIDISDLAPNAFPARGKSIVLKDRKSIPELTRARTTGLDDFYRKLQRDRCGLPTVGPNCLAVQWADNYCYAMADHMCDELAKPPFGMDPGKVWLHGDLQMKSANHPENCHFEWNYHVAAFVRLNGVPGDAGVRIIDPAACIDGPLTLLQWRTKIQGQEETPDFTPRTVFEQVQPGDYLSRHDDDSAAFYLSLMRAELKTRIRRTRPQFPPYGNCPRDAPCP